VSAAGSCTIVRVRTRAARRAWLAIGLVVVAGSACGRIEYAQRIGELDGGAADGGPVAEGGRLDASSADAAPGDAAPGDAAPDGGACAEWGTFDAPVRLAELATPGVEWSPWLSRDQLRLYFASSVPGSETDLYYASRSSPTGMFGGRTALGELNTAAEETEPALRGDELEIIFEVGGLLLTATRTGRDLPFDAPFETLGFTVGGSQRAPFFVDDRTIYRAQDEIGRTDKGLVIDRRADPDSPWITERYLDELASAEDENYPTVSADELEIFFWSDRSGRGQIHRATRTSTAVPFSAPTLVTELDLGGLSQSSDPELAIDGRTLFFASDGGTSGTGWDLWYATRDCVR
jgi:hypothetical protein